MINVLFQANQFSITNSIWPTDKTLSGATTPDQCEPGSDSNEGILHIPQSSCITGASPSDVLVSYQGHSLRESYPSALYSTAHYRLGCCLRIFCSPSSSWFCRAIKSQGEQSRKRSSALPYTSVTLSRHLSLSFIASKRSSGLHPVSSHSCCMWVRAGRPAFARPCEGVHWSTSFMSSYLLR